MTACLEETYPTTPGEPPKPKRLAVFKIQPLSPHGRGSCFIIWAEASLHPKKTPVELMEMSLSQTSWENSQMGFGLLASIATPALLPC